MTIKLLIFAVYVLIATMVIRATPPGLALEHDAKSYYDTAVKMVENNNIVKTFFSTTPQFIDHGYPTFLAFVMQFVGTSNVIAFQIANYLLWALSAYLIYRSLKLLQSDYANIAGLLMLFSPLYLTFSGKIYSEPFACLGSSLIIYSFVSMIKKPSLISKISLTLGGIILFSTKSALMPIILALIIFLYLKKQFKYLIFLSLVPLILFPSIIGSLGGGRSLYTLNIQSSKLGQSYDQIFACIPYYLSYPLGIALVPQYQGACHQNDATPEMPMYENNPYLMADISRELGFTYTDWLSRIFHYPFKYLIVMIVSLSNLILIEGIYPSILLLFPFPLMLIGFVLCKIILSLFLWATVWKTIKKNWIYVLPILYFVLVLTNFPVEPRYFYPFIPYMYFLGGLTVGKEKNK